MLLNEAKVHPLDCDKYFNEPNDYVMKLHKKYFRVNLR